MGTRLSRFIIRPGENEQIEAKIQMPEEPRSVIHGVVIDECNKPIKDAVVKLFEKYSCHSICALKPITHAFTDDCGQFLFGPLDPWQYYVIKVWYNDVKIRKIFVNCQERMNIELTDVEDNQVENVEVVNVNEDGLEDKDE